jgi:hypothetical protein
MSRGRIVLVCALIACVAASAAGQSVGLDAAVREAQAGRLAAALRAAEGETDPLRRSQARVYTLSNAGDLTGAIRAARAGLSSHPDDLWLLERVCSLTIAVRATAEAQDALARTIELLEQRPLDNVERLRWNETVTRYSAEVDELVALAAKQSDARARARWTILVAGGSLLATLCWGAFPRQKKPPQRSVDSQGRPSSPGFS